MARSAAGNRWAVQTRTRRLFATLARRQRDHQEGRAGRRLFEVTEESLERPMVDP